MGTVEEKNNEYKTLRAGEYSHTECLTANQLSMKQ